MNRREAVQHLHARHPRVIDAPGPEVDLQTLHLEMFWFQSRVCEYLDRRSERTLRRCFATIDEIFTKGDDEVKSAVCSDFFLPHLVFHPDLDWAQLWMPAPLSNVCAVVRRSVMETLPRRGVAGE